MGQGPPNRGRRGYASGLDGIRALAVIAVILFHAGVPALRGGFVGVDLFFVVSGYLVTALLQREFDRTGRIRFGSFIARRGRRLVPALLLMLIVVSAATLALGRDLGVDLRNQLLGAFTFSSNWMQIAKGTSYVSDAEPAILTHLWSLAVEEQFYLLWPAVCLLLLTVVRPRRRRVAIGIVLAVVSAAAMAAAFRAGSDPTRAYEGTDTHGFGLLLGAALAFGWRSSGIGRTRGQQLKPLTGPAAAVGPVALLVIAAGAVLLHDSTSVTYRGGLLAVNVAAVVLVAVTVRGVGVVPTLLSLRLLRGVGRRSYALYLWHWPALVIAERMLAPSVGHAWAATIAIASALIATEVSWRCVELPIRRRGVTGYLRSIRTMMFNQPNPSGRRIGWLTAGSVALVLGIAACSVVVAPQQSELAMSLAAGEAALAQASAQQQPGRSGSPAPMAVLVPAQPPDPTTVRPANPHVVTVPPLDSPPTAPSTTPVTTASPTPVLVTSPAALPSPTAAAPPALHAGSTATRRAPQPTPAPLPGSQISAIGDSVMLASAPALLTRFAGADIDAVVSRQIWDLAPLIREQISARRLRSHLLIGLGTNGTDSTEHIGRALAQLPAGEVVILVNSFVPDSWQDDVNAHLNAAAAARPHTCVADWHAAIGSHRALLGPDGVHPGEPGGKLYATVIADALQRCH